ncbi:MAG: tetratricopeptide repeat protein [Flavisolibacter sp.]|jgi:tetratricopeptide (TPR) repeat protein|nr:tetratricopeptide repeat protein [Flavisolibacter sp.]
MHKIILFVTLVVCVSCNNQEEGDLLKQEPYSALTDSIASNPSNPELYYRRGTLLFQENQKALAEADIRKAWNLNPQEKYGLSLTTILKNKHTDSAIVFLEDAIKRMPESIALHVGLARGYQQKEMYDEAIKIIDYILEQFPGQLDALTIKSEILGEQNKNEESLLYLEKAYSLAPSDPDLAYDLAYEYAMGRNEKVLLLTDSLVKARASNIEKAYFTRGLYYSNIGNATEALRLYNDAIKANYNFNDAYLEKGIILFRQKKFEDAQRNFEVGLRVAPANALFFFWLAKSQEARGFIGEAKANYQSAYALDKDLVDARQAAEKLR